MPSINDLKQATEAERLAMIRDIVDRVAHRIENEGLTKTAARDLAATVRFQVGLVMPEQMDTYDLIYGSRLERLIQQFILSREK